MPMIQCPSAVGLTLCKMVTIEEKTRNVTLANSFVQLSATAFPAIPDPFCVYTILTDGLGDITLNLVVSRCDTFEEIYVRSFKTRFNDPLRQLRLWWQIRSCSFPAPGAYQFGLQADGEPITQAVLHLKHKGPNHG